MAKVKQVLNGVAVQVAAGTRKCNHSKKHSIAKGETCLAVKDPYWGSWRSYCIECGRAILKVAEIDLEELKAELEVPIAARPTIANGQAGAQLALASYPQRQAARESARPASGADCRVKMETRVGTRLRSGGGRRGEPWPTR